MTTLDAINRVRKLLCLANDKGATEGEAKNAKVAAQRLIDRFRLTKEFYAPSSQVPRFKPIICSVVICVYTTTVTTGSDTSNGSEWYSMSNVC